MAISGLSLLVWSIQPLPLFWQVITPEFNISTNAEPPMQVVYQNVDIDNQHPDKIIKQLLGADLNFVNTPDVVALVEAGGANWQPALRPLNNHYPRHCGVDESSPFAMQVYAKDAEASCEILKLQGFALAKLTLSANFDLSTQTTRIIYVAHPPPPINSAMAQARNDYLDELAALINADSDHALMMVGDFNLSAFSPLYRDFIKKSTTDNASLHRTTLTGQPTWLPFGIGIDQILVNHNRRQTNTQALAWDGSDHRGFRIEWF